jgi:hypothetical protein
MQYTRCASQSQHCLPAVHSVLGGPLNSSANAFCTAPSPLPEAAPNPPLYDVGYNSSYDHRRSHPSFPSGPISHPTLSARPATSYYSPSLVSAMAGSSGSSPAFPMPEIPAALRPGRGSSMHFADSDQLFFRTSTSSTSSPATSPPATAPAFPAFPTFTRPSSAAYPFQMPQVHNSYTSYTNHTNHTNHTNALPAWANPQPNSPSGVLGSSHSNTAPGFYHPDIAAHTNSSLPEHLSPPASLTTTSSYMPTPDLRSSSPAQPPWLSEKARLAATIDGGPPGYIHPAEYEGEDDRAGLQAALQMSQQHEEEQAELARREEEELARVLAESAIYDEDEERSEFPTPTVVMMPEPSRPEPQPYSDSSTSNSHSNSYSNSHGSVSSHGGAEQSTTTSIIMDDNESTIWPARRDSVLEQMRADEELARRLAAEDDSGAMSPMSPAVASSKGPWQDSAPDSHAQAPPPYLPNGNGNGNGGPSSSPHLTIVPPHINAEIPNMGTGIHRTQSASAVQPSPTGLGWSGRVPLPLGPGAKGRSHSVSATSSGTPSPVHWNAPASAGLSKMSTPSTLSSPPLSVVSEDDYGPWGMPEGPASPATPLAGPVGPVAIDEILMGVCKSLSYSVLFDCVSLTAFVFVSL